MVMPLAGRVVAAVIGGLLVLTSVSSVTGTLIVSRSVSSRLDGVGRPRRRRGLPAGGGAGRRLPAARPGARHPGGGDLAGAAGGLAGIVAFVGFALLLWPFAARGVIVRLHRRRVLAVHPGLRRAGRGSARPLSCSWPRATGLVIVTLQIAYLPTLYAAFNRRETEVALLNARAGVPSWGPELLARTHYALGSGVSTIDTMPDLYAQWERWAADVAESHTTYLPLVRFRSPTPLSSWVTALLAVLDSAALFLALSPEIRAGGPGAAVPARRIPVLQPDRPGDGHRGSRRARPERRDQPEPTQEFLDAVARMREVDFPIERDPADGMAGLRRLAAQLRAGRLCGGRRRRRRAGAVVGPAPPRDAHIAPIRPRLGRPPK